MRNNCSKIILLFLATILPVGVVHGQTSESPSEIKIQVRDLNNEAAKKIREGKYDDAIAVMKTAVQLNPNFSEGLARLGLIYIDLSKYDEAVEYFQRVIKITPHSAIAHYNLGCAYILWNRYKEAVASLEHSIRLDPTYAETYVQLGYALSRQKKYRDAIKPLEEAIKLNPNDVEVRYFLGQLYLVNGDKQEALLQYGRMSLIDQPSANKLYALIYGKMLVSIGKK